MLTASPAKKSSQLVDRSPFCSPLDRHTCKAEIIGSSGRQFGCSPKTPLVIVDDRIEGSLGKRNLAALLQSDKKENRDNSAGLSKPRHQRLQELDERYRQLTLKLAGNVCPKPATLRVQGDDSDQVFEVGKERVLTFQDPNIQMIPEASPPPAKAGCAVNVELEEPQLAEAELHFEADKVTKLAFRAYAARTHNGTVRAYNEDRVSIIQKIVADGKQAYPTSYFGLFDGHSGANVVDFLRDRLHELLTRQPTFASDKQAALRAAFAAAETQCLSVARASGDRSGSCALICLLERDRLILANLGDSRGVLGSHRGRVAVQLTNDHKPEADQERTRIFAHGGHIFRSKKTTEREVLDSAGRSSEAVEEIRYGPFRVEPGGLSVSRTIGDLPAKDASRRGNPKCVIAEPELSELQLTADHDLLVLACDGVFDVLTNKEVVDAAWLALQTHAKPRGLKEACRLAAERVMQLAFDKKSADNVTVIVLAFQPEHYYYY